MIWDPPGKKKDFGSGTPAALFSLSSLSHPDFLNHHPHHLFFFFLFSSHDGKYIVSGSENQYIYMWKTHHDYAKFSSARRDRNDYWEAIKAHNAVVTCAVFAPDSHALIEQMDRYRKDREDEVRGAGPSRPVVAERAVSPGGSSSSAGYVLVSADFNGCIKVFVNRVKPKHSSLPVSALS